LYAEIRSRLTNDSTRFGVSVADVLSGVSTGNGSLIELMSDLKAVNIQTIDE